MTREEIEKRMEELTRKYVETHDREIMGESYNFTDRAARLRRWRNSEDLIAPQTPTAL
jgi:hypothetical protein